MQSLQFTSIANFDNLETLANFYNLDNFLLLCFGSLWSNPNVDIVEIVENIENIDNDDNVDNGDNVVNVDNVDKNLSIGTFEAIWNNNVVWDGYRSVSYKWVDGWMDRWDVNLQVGWSIEQLTLLISLMDSGVTL